MAAKKKYKDFESAVERLEEITDILESGESTLEESITLYTEGLEIAKWCDKKLNEAEGKIKLITNTDSGFTEEEFETKEAD
jgi:exodeoxyribonuclease VII small subunit